jgi:uncharacterized membrane protein
MLTMMTSPDSEKSPVKKLVSKDIAVGEIYTGGRNNDQRQVLEKEGEKIKVKVISGLCQGEEIWIELITFWSWIKAGWKNHRE